MIDSNRNFVNNTDLNEVNSLTHLIEYLDPIDEGEVNPIHHSNYYNNEEFIEAHKHIDVKLSILNLNCQCVNSKFDKIKLFLEGINNNSMPVSVITLQETWADNETEMNFFNLPNYTMVYDDSRLSKHGGLVTYIHNTFTFERLSDDIYNQNSTVYESMFLKIHNKSSKFIKYIIGNIYRRPSSTIDELGQFIDEFTTVTQNLQEQHMKSYLCGDYNINLLKIDSSLHCNRFFENITTLGFFPQITRPTRLSGESNTLIDNIFTNDFCKPHLSGILVTPISDHLMQFCTIIGKKERSSKNYPKYIEVENLSPLAMNNFKQAIVKSNVYQKLKTDPDANPNNNYEILSAVIMESKANHLPKKTQRFNKYKHKKEKWMSSALLKSVVHKNKLYRDWKSTTDNNEYRIKQVNFKTYERILKNMIKESKQKYYFDTFSAQKNDIKKTWATIDEKLNRKKNTADFPEEFLYKEKTITDLKDIAKSFNEYFSNIGPSLSEKIDMSGNTMTYSDYLTNPAHSRFSFTPVSEKETLNIINNLKNKKSYGIDGISNVLLKSIANEILKPLTLIINQSLETGIFPDAFKTSKVTPLYKKGDKTDLNNYRPISILPTISKVFERVIHVQLYDYFCKNNLLCEQQYGFRSKHSTELATIKLVDFLVKSMDENKIPGAIYLDLSKAFDTLNFNILINKLKFYGFTGTPLKLLENYLRDRHQFVAFKNINSDLKEIRTGIPQGSILGPLFFSIYINDLINSSNLFNYLMYADDTTLYFNLEDVDSVNMSDNINIHLEKINVWLKLNKLTVNVSKTKFMIFHKRRDTPQLDLLLNNIKIDLVSNFTFLGIILDSSLSWKNHTKMIAIKISKIIGILHKLKYIFPKEILLIIYKSLIVPHLNYGLLLWGVNLKDIFLLQKKAIRLVTHNSYTSHTEPIFKENGLLNLADMFLLNKLKFLHKIFHNNLPSYFETYWEHFTQSVVNYNLRSRILPVPRIYHVYAESLFVYQLVKILNDFEYLIIIKLRERSHSFAGFSNYITRYLIDKYSDKKICDVPDCFACK